MSVRDVQLHVAEIGTGDPVVLLHGIGQHWYAWHKVAPLLAADHRVICIDLRGFGWSEETRSGYSIDGLTEDVLAVMDELGLARADLVGHNIGAEIGLRIGLAHPSRLRSLVALNAMHPWPLKRRVVPNLWRMWFTALWEYPLLGRLVLRHWPGLTRFLLRHQVADRDAWAPGDLEEFVDATQWSARAVQSVLWQYVVHEMAGRALGTRRGRRLEVPTVLIAGAQDPVIPTSVLAGADRHADRFEVRVVEAVGHFAHEEAPAVVAGTVRSLSRVPVAHPGKGRESDSV